MASQAAPRDFGDVFLCVLALHRLLVMAAITINICAAATVTLAALPSRITVVHRERMVRD